MSKDKTLLALKNIIHNDLGVTRADIMEVARDCIHDVVDRQVKRILAEQGHTLTERIDYAVAKEATNIVKKASWTGERRMVDGIAKAVSDQIVISMREK